MKAFVLFMMIGLLSYKVTASEISIHQEATYLCGIESVQTAIHEAKMKSEKEARRVCDGQLEQPSSWSIQKENCSDDNYGKTLIVTTDAKYGCFSTRCRRFCINRGSYYQGCYWICD